MHSYFYCCHHCHFHNHHSYVWRSNWTFRSVNFACIIFVEYEPVLHHYKIFLIYKQYFLLDIVVLSYLNDSLTSIKFSREKTLEGMVEFRRHQPKRFGKLIVTRTQGFAKQSFDSIPNWIEVKIYILFCKTKYYVTITNKIIVTNLINQTLPKCNISYLTFWRLMSTIVVVPHR